MSYAYLQNRRAEHEGSSHQEIVENDTNKAPSALEETEPLASEDSPCEDICSEEFTDGQAVMEQLDYEEMLEYEESESVRDEEAAAVQSFIASLSGAFDRTLELYEDLKSRQSHQRTDLMTHLYALFVQMSEKLNRIVAPAPSTPSNQNELLEKYSDLLVEKVMEKLNKAK